MVALAPQPPVPPAGTPFVLLDDARAGGAPARLYTGPRHILVATKASQVHAVIDAASTDTADAAGFLSYAAGGAFEPRAADPHPCPTPPGRRWGRSPRRSAMTTTPRCSTRPRR